MRRADPVHPWGRTGSSSLRPRRFDPHEGAEGPSPHRRRGAAKIGGVPSTWEHLRQQSNVTLGKIELGGAKSSRRVSLDVTVDGVAGAALGGYIEDALALVHTTELPNPVLRRTVPGFSCTRP